MIKTFQGENRYLSNFFPATVSMIPPFGDSQEMVKAKTSEHLYQAFKADNEEEFYEILNAKTPGDRQNGWVKNAVCETIGKTSSCM